MYKGFTAPDTEFDTAIAQYVIDPTKSNYNMKTLAFENLHYELKDEKEFMEESGQIDLLGGSTSKYIDYGFDWCLAVKRLMQDVYKRQSHESLRLQCGASAAG